MKRIFLTQPNEFQKARKMEEILLMLPEDGGIRFVGVEVIPQETRPLYKVFIGCSRERDASLMTAIVMQYLRDEVEDEDQLEVVACRGVDRATHKPYV